MLVEHGGVCDPGPQAVRGVWRDVLELHGPAAVRLYADGRWRIVIVGVSVPHVATHRGTGGIDLTVGREVRRDRGTGRRLQDDNGRVWHGRFLGEGLTFPRARSRR